MADSVGGEGLDHATAYSGNTTDTVPGDLGSGESPTDSWVIELLSQLHLVSLPLICISGVVGNVLAFFIFASKPMRRTSCSWYLATRSVADGGFLLATFITWSSDASRKQFFHTEGLCQVTIFSTFVFAFLSVWMTVVVTSENFIRICRPFSVSTFCNVRIAKMCILLLVCLSLAMYNYPLWTNSVLHHQQGNKSFYWCGTLPEYISLVKWMSFWDLLITLIVPSLIIIILMVFITASLVHSLKRQTRLQGKGQRSNGNTRPGNGDQANQVNRSSRSSNSPQAKVTRMLFAVSLLFVVLNAPSHIIRTKMAVVELVDGPARSHAPTAEEKIQVVFQIIYYLSFGVNLLVYLTCGDNFRKIFKETYLKLCLRPPARGVSNEMTALTTVRLDDNETTRHDPTPVAVRADQKPFSSETNGNNENGEVNEANEIHVINENKDGGGGGEDETFPEVIHDQNCPMETRDDKNLINLQTTDL